MSIHMSGRSGSSKTYKKYPADAIFVNGKRVIGVYVNGTKVYPNNIVDTEMAIYEAEYILDYASSSSDGMVYAAVNYWDSYSAEATAIENCIVNGKIRFFVPKNIELFDACHVSVMLSGICYSHNTYTVICNIPESYKTLHGGLKYDIIDSLRNGYAFEEYAYRQENGLVHIKTPKEDTPNFFGDPYCYGMVGNSNISKYNDQAYGAWSHPVPVYLCVRNRRSGYSGYNSPLFAVYQNARYIGIGNPKDLMIARSLFDIEV